MTAVFFQQDGVGRLAVASASAAATTIRTSLPCDRRVQLRLLDGSEHARVGLPATIEGALRSGETAAALALRHLSL